MSIAWYGYQSEELYLELLLHLCHRRIEGHLCYLRREISRGGKSAKTYTTTNLKKHLHCRHQAQFKEFEQQEEAKTGDEANKQSGSRPSRRQVFLVFVVGKHQPFGFDHSKAREINRLVAELIAVDNQPFSVVDDIGFNRLIHHLEPRYNFPVGGPFQKL